MIAHDKFSGIFLFHSFSLLILIRFSTSNDNFLLFAEDTLEKTHGQIIHSSILFRHGKRSNGWVYPADPIKESAWPDGFGQLTQAGKKDEYNLGRWLHQRYKKLPRFTTYRYDRVLVNSTEPDHTFCSALSVLAGLFPPNETNMNTTTTSQQLPKLLRLWQPITVHTTPRYQDNVIGLMAACPRFNLEMSNLNNLPEFENYSQQYADLFDYLSAHMGLQISTHHDVYTTALLLTSIYDVFYVENENNYTLPSWTEKVFPEPLATASRLTFILNTYTPELRRLQGGPLVSSIVQDMNMKRSGAFNQNLHLYSGHDNTVSTLLSVLGVFNGLRPPTSSAVLLELRQKADNYVVTMLYRNSSDTPPVLLKIPGCENICKLDQFVGLTKPLIPEDWNDECQLGFFETIFQQFNVLELIIMFCGAVGLIFLAMVALRICAIKRRIRYNSF